MPPRTRKTKTIETTAGGAPSAATLRRALDELQIDRPFYTCRVVGNQLEFSLYGGDLVYWPPKAPRTGRRRATNNPPPTGRGRGREE